MEWYARVAKIDKYAFRNGALSMLSGTVRYCRILLQRLHTGGGELGAIELTEEIGYLEHP